MANIGEASLNDAQRKLVEENIGLVYSQASKRGIYDEDLIQEGMMGLINAARFYSPDFGAKFSTYASSYIWAALFGSYSYKKNLKKAAMTDSLDDENRNIQPSVEGCFSDLHSECHPLANDVIRYTCDGYTKKEITQLLSISNYKLNSILDKIGRDLYGERYVEKTDK